MGHVEGTETDVLLEFWYVFPIIVLESICTTSHLYLQIVVENVWSALISAVPHEVILFVLTRNTEIYCCWICTIERKTIPRSRLGIARSIWELTAWRADISGSFSRSGAGVIGYPEQY